MSITISRSGKQQTFDTPDGIREFVDGIICEVHNITDTGSYAFTTINFGALRFQPMILWDQNLQRVRDWTFVAMAGLNGIYARQKENA